MAKYELILPKMGESVAEASITAWLVQEGENIEAEDGALEIATDKVDSEVPSPVSGTLIKQLYEVGDVVKVGATVAIIETEEAEGNVQNVENINTGSNSAENNEETKSSSSAAETDLSSEVPLPKSIIEHESNTLKITNTTDRFYSPLVKSIAKKENISQNELDEIKGSGRNNRLTKGDLLNYLKTRNSKAHTNTTTSNQVTAKQTRTAAANEAVGSPVSPAVFGTPATSISGNDEIIEMDRMRKLIAENMLKSKQISPHVTSMVEVDVTNVFLWRNQMKDQFQEKEKSKLTFTPLFIEAVAKALRDFPMVNISIDGDKIIVKKDINVGMAVALPSGNLIVPVIKNADQLNLIGLSKKVNEMTDKARKNKLGFEDIQGGTFTLTNIGTFGNAIGTPIINQPEVAIMSTGIIQKKPAVIETPQGDTIGIRHMMFLSMSYDHRVVDGMLGGSFLRRVADYLENFDFNRQIW